ncbi:MAG: HemK/PrmC family methyltransferase [bacterium]|nr:HemK/PrmC family methyltransferase [bacterium]
MTVHSLLAGAYRNLAHLETPELDAEVLLGHVLAKPRAFLFAHPEHPITREQARDFEALAARRSTHAPIAYLTGTKEFYGRNFLVDSRVHIPKPATEDLIDAIKRDISEHFDGAFADIGTGSGCIAITLALEFPNASIIATDISDGALAVARTNANALGAASRITFLNRPGGGPFKNKVDIVAANLPYGWQGGWTRDAEVLFQPEISYLGGVDPSGILGTGSSGLDAIAALIRQLPHMLAKNGRAYLEFDPRQTDAIKKLASENGYESVIIKDSAGFDRIAALAK